MGMRVTCPRDQIINAGTRWVLVAINTFLLIVGGAMVILGARVAHHTQELSESPLPDLWWLGLMPLTIGLLGLVSTLIGDYKWLLAWAVYSTIVGPGSYAYFVHSGCYNPEVFGVTTKIYGACFQERDLCRCIWSHGSIGEFNRRICMMIEMTSSIYLSQMILMTLSLASSIIGCFVAATATCCNSCCSDQPEEEQSLLDTECILTSEDKDSSRTRTYMTDYVPPHKTRTYVSNSDSDTHITML